MKRPKRAGTWKSGGVLPVGDRASNRVSRPRAIRYRPPRWTSPGLGGGSPGVRLPQGAKIMHVQRSQAAAGPPGKPATRASTPGRGWGKTFQVRRSPSGFSIRAV